MLHDSQNGRGVVWTLRLRLSLFVWLNAPITPWCPHFLFTFSLSASDTHRPRLAAGQQTPTTVWSGHLDDQTVTSRTCTCV